MDAIDRQFVDQWHLARNGKQYGPYRFSTLVEAVKRSALSEDDQVWRPGWDSWRPAHSVPELFVPPDGRSGLQTPRVDAHAVHAPANTGAQIIASKPAKGLTGFFKRLAQYYAEFLSTDFKKQRLPRRRLENADALGRLVGIPLRKYPGFQQKLWGELAKPIGAGLSVMVSRGSWRAVLPKAVVETTATYIAQVAQKDVDAVVNGVMKNTLHLAKQKGDDPDIAFEQFIEEVRASLAREIIGPLLDRMEGFFARTENKPVESLRELEDQLSARLGSGIEKSSGAAFSKLLVEGSSESLEGLLRDQLEINLIRRELEAFFATFTAADLYVDLSDLVRSFRLVENADFYLHIGEIHHAGHVFPIFYIPFTAERTEQGFKINSEPRLYVNKRAMDYVAQEVAKAEGRATIPSMLRERIFYLSPEQSALGEAQKIFDDLAGSFNLRAEIDFKAPRDQKVSSLLVVATNRLSFSLFDRSDDSMVNDHEALITGIEAGDSVVGFFESLIDEFLLKNPISVRADIDGEWADMPMPQRLVFDSPLPLVEDTFGHQALEIEVHRGRRTSRHGQIAHNHRRRIRPNSGRQKSSRPVRQEGSSRCRRGQAESGVDQSSAIRRLPQSDPTARYGRFELRAVVEKKRNRTIASQSTRGAPASAGA